MQCETVEYQFIKDQEASGLLSSLEIKKTFKWNSSSRHYFVLRVLNMLIQGLKWMK